MSEEQKQSTGNLEENQGNTVASVVANETDNPSDSSPVAEELQSAPESSESLSEEDSVVPESEKDDVISVLQQENANLRKMLDERIEQGKAIKGQYARLAADFDNFRKRNTKEKENLQQQAKKNVILELLPVVDNFERARTQIKPANDGEKGIHSSYQGVYKTLVDCLKKMGVAAMRPEGQQFDPNYHEAMLREQTNDSPEGTVIEQLMRGYTLGEDVLRHAMVKVAVPAETTTEVESTEEDLADELESLD